MLKSSYVLLTAVFGNQRSVAVPHSGSKQEQLRHRRGVRND